MADKGIGNRGIGNQSDVYGGRPPERQRFKKLAQAALNADMTVDQIEAILSDMSDVLVDMNKTIGGLDGAIESLDTTMNRISGTLDQVDKTVVTMTDVVDRLENIVGRIEALVGIGEAALRPIGAIEGAIESAGRTLASRLGLGNGQ